MNTRTSLVTLATLAALATTALTPTSAAAWGTGHFGESTMNNQGPGFGGTSNATITHPGSHVPGATLGATGHHTGNSTTMPNTGSSGMPNTGSTSTPMPTHTTGGTTPANGQSGQGGWPGGNPNHPSNGDGGWTPGSQGGHGPWSQGGGHGPWSQGQMEHNQPCGYGGCGEEWHHWHRPWYGSGSYPTVETYAPPTPVYTQAPVQTTYAPAPQTYVQPTVQSYASAPPPAPCTCLTKSYAQDGSVMFADNCTKESAVAAPQQARY